MTARAFLTLTLTALALTACGKTVPQRSDKGQTDLPVSSPSKDIDGNWQLSLKTCNETPVAARPREAYLFNEMFFVRIETLSETPDELCKIAYVYDRIITSYGYDANLYIERATLNPTALKTSCWKKIDGAVVGDSVDEVDDFEGEPENSQLQLRDGKIGLLITGNPECAGTLKLELHR